MAQHRDGADALPTHDATPVEERTTERAHDALLAMLATHTGQIVWVCDAAGLVTWEAGWSAYTGLTPDGVVGMRWLNVVHPDDVSASMQVWAHALETRQPYEVQQRLLRADGEYRVFRSRAMPVPHDDGTVREWVGVSVDITEFAESAAERELALTRESTAWAQREDAHRRLLMSLESTTDQVLIVDREWRITYMNAAAALEAGVDRSDYVGYDLFEKSRVSSEANLNAAIGGRLPNKPLWSSRRGTPSEPHGLRYMCIRGRTAWPSTIATLRRRNDTRMSFGSIKWICGHS